MGFTKKYEREIMESEEGKSLYQRWSKYISKNNDGQEFATFLGFYQWAMEAGYTLEAQLYRLDSKAPYSADNCHWITAEKCIRSDLVEFEKKWNDLGGGKHPIDLTDDEYTLIINYRASDESAKDTFKRMLAYASKMRELK